MECLFFLFIFCLFFSVRIFLIHSVYDALANSWSDPCKLMGTDLFCCYLYFNSFRPIIYFKFTTTPCSNPSPKYFHLLSSSPGHFGSIKKNSVLPPISSTLKTNHNEMFDETGTFFWCEERKLADAIMVNIFI